MLPLLENRANDSNVSTMHALVHVSFNDRAFEYVEYKTALIYAKIFAGADDCILKISQHCQGDKKKLMTLDL